MRQTKSYIYPIVLFILFFYISFTSVSHRIASAGEKGASLLRMSKAQMKSVPTVISKIRHSNHPDYTRVVIDLNQPPSYTVTRDKVSQTLLVKLEASTLGISIKRKPSLSITGDLIEKIEVTQKGEKTVYIALLYKQLGQFKHLILENPNRLVIDLFPPQPTPPPPSFTIQTIVIDPGHGGKDPGARSKAGLQEKDVALDISKRLKTLIEKRLGKKVILTRDKDIFISLKKRTEIANENKADLFISVHINSSRSRKLKGIEVYLVGKASDERAMVVAARENAETHDSVVNFQEMILNDLERDFTRNASLELAHFTNDALKKNLMSKYPTKALGVKRAPFYVLNHTEMPAILAEISFISNRKEEKRLRSKNYRQRAAESLLKGIEAYIRSFEIGT